MFNIFRIRWHQFWEEAKDKSFQEAVRKAIAKCFVTNQVVVPVFNDLSNSKADPKSDSATSLQFHIISARNLDALAPLVKTTSRRLKMYHNTAAGYYAYTVASQGEIIGDIWCATPREVAADPIHPDLPWLEINCGKNDAYMFDMYVVPDSRGKVTTSFLLGGALNHLKEEGFEKVYGFYEKSNLPALWTHRLFGYSELGKRRSFRFLCFKKTERLGAAE